MIAVLQRVSEASVRVDGVVIGQIGAGLLVLLCAEKGDTEAVADKMLAKMLKLRIFSDEAGKMNLSLQDVGGGLLVVSQFTLAADVAGATARASPRQRPQKTVGVCMNTSQCRPEQRTLWCKRGSSPLT